jgi:hypothetical protein
MQCALRGLQGQLAVLVLYLRRAPHFGAFARAARRRK